MTEQMWQHASKKTNKQKKNIDAKLYPSLTLSGLTQWLRASLVHKSLVWTVCLRAGPYVASLPTLNLVLAKKTVEGANSYLVSQ